MKLCLTIDCDSDFVRNPREKDAITWNGAKHGLPRLMSTLMQWCEHAGIRLSVVLFVRSDDQVAYCLGRHAELFARIFRNAKQEKWDIDSEIEWAWHPHLYEFQTSGFWELSLADEKQREQLVRTYAALSNEGWHPAVSRIGECLFSEQILNTLVELGIQVDSTALPGRINAGTDWANAPSDPYFPDRNDFKSFGDSAILEVPFSMVPIRAPCENLSRLRYINLVNNIQFQRDGLIGLSMSRKTIVVIVHAYEYLALCEGWPDRHPLWGGARSLIENLDCIRYSCLRNGDCFELTTLSKIRLDYEKAFRN
jgi:hypothetical protein